jgi:hypothetical protein
LDEMAGTGTAQELTGDLDCMNRYAFPFDKQTHSCQAKIVKLVIILWKRYWVGRRAGG